MEFEREMALFQSGVRIAFRLPGAPVPEHHRAAAILAFRDCPLEGAVSQGMILGPHRQPLVGRVEAGTFGHGPAQQNAVQLQPEIVMQARGIVFLDQVRKLLVSAPRPCRAAVRWFFRNRACACILQAPCQPPL